MVCLYPYEMFMKKTTVKFSKRSPILYFGIAFAVLTLIFPAALQAEISLAAGMATLQGTGNSSMPGYFLKADLDLADTLFTVVVKYSRYSGLKEEPESQLQKIALGCGYKFLWNINYEITFSFGGVYDFGTLLKYNYPVSGIENISVLRPWLGISLAYDLFNSGAWLQMQYDYAPGDANVDKYNMNVMIGIEYYLPLFSTHRRQKKMGHTSLSDKSFDLYTSDIDSISRQLLEAYVLETAQLGAYTNYSLKKNEMKPLGNASYEIKAKYALSKNGRADVFEAVLKLAKTDENNWLISEISKVLILSRNMNE